MSGIVLSALKNNEVASAGSSR